MLQASAGHSGSVSVSAILLLAGAAQSHSLLDQRDLFSQIVPGLGDVVNFLLSYMLVINPATKDEKVPAGLKSKMVSNQVVAFFAGLTPLAGAHVKHVCILIHNLMLLPRR